MTARLSTPAAKVRQENVALLKVGQKRCGTCRCVKAAEEFPYRRDSKYPSSTFRTSRCQGCSRIAAVASRARHPETVRANHRLESRRRAESAGRVYQPRDDAPRRRAERAAARAAWVLAVRQPREDARAAWDGWLARAPAWWLAAYAEALRMKKVARSRRQHIRRVAGVETGAGSTRRKRWALCAEQADGSLTVDVVEKLYAEALACSYCGIALNFDNQTLDHVVALEVGGLHGVSNLTPACRSCNTSKGSKDLDAWMDEGTGPPARARTLGYRGASEFG